MSEPISTQKPWDGRFEDENLLRGLGQFSDDLREPNTTFACFVRSPHTSAKIHRIDTENTKKLPGVITILAGADLAATEYESVTRPYPPARHIH